MDHHAQDKNKLEAITCVIKEKQWKLAGQKWKST